MSELKYLNAVHLWRHLIPPTSHPLSLHLGFRFDWQEIWKHWPIQRKKLDRKKWLIPKKPFSLHLGFRFGLRDNIFTSIWLRDEIGSHSPNLTNHVWLFTCSSCNKHTNATNSQPLSLHLDLAERPMQSKRFGNTNFRKHLWLHRLYLGTGEDLKRDQLLSVLLQHHQCNSCNSRNIQRLHLDLTEG